MENNKDIEIIQKQSEIKKIDTLISKTEEKYQFDILKLKNNLLRIWTDIFEDFNKVKIQIEFHLIIDLKSYKHMPAEQFKHLKEIVQWRKKLKNILFNQQEVEKNIEYHKSQYSVIKVREIERIEELKAERMIEENIYKNVVPLLEKLTHVKNYYEIDSYEISDEIKQSENGIMQIERGIMADIMKEQDIFSDYFFYIKMIKSIYFEMSMLKEDFIKNVNLLNFKKNELYDQVADLKTS